MPAVILNAIRVPDADDPPDVADASEPTSRDAALRAAAWLEQHAGQLVRHVSTFNGSTRPVYATTRTLIGAQPPFHYPGNSGLWALVVHYELDGHGQHPASQVMAIEAADVDEQQLRVRSPRFEESLTAEGWKVKL